jgi:S-adenosylmethionine/arginine decarboxylase-like enzyme
MVFNGYAVSKHKLRLHGIGIILLIERFHANLNTFRNHAYHTIDFGKCKTKLLPQFIKELIGVKLSTRTIFAALKPQNIHYHSIDYDHIMKTKRDMNIWNDYYR